MEKTVERVLLRVELREVGGGREAPGVRTEREGELSSVRVSARVPSSQLDVGRMEVSLCFVGTGRGSVARRRHTEQDKTGQE